MLHRSASSRRRRASPSVANTQPAGVSSTMRGRRASVATEKPLILPPSSPGETMERQRSPRGSMVPNIALDTESHSPDEVSIHPLTFLEFPYNFFIYIYFPAVITLAYSINRSNSPWYMCSYKMEGRKFKSLFSPKNYVCIYKRVTGFLKPLGIIRANWLGKYFCDASSYVKRK